MIRSLFRAENYQNISATVFEENALIGQAATHLDYQVYIYIGLVCMTLLLGYLQAVIFYTIAQHAGRLLHNMAIGSLLQAPLTFFEANSRGKYVFKINQFT